MTKHQRFATKRRVLAITSISVLVLCLSSAAFAQESDDNIEGLFNKDEQTQETPAAPNKSVDVNGPDASAAEGTSAGITPAPANGKVAGKNGAIRDVSDLGKLSEFSDIAVIQRRYLPKTGRFEAFLAPSLILNDAFFINYGLSGRLNYSFSERYAVELLGTAFSTAERSITTELRTARGVITTSLITPKSYVGADFRWTPVYGKMAWLNGKITPFDLYFSAGLGLTGTNLGTSETTLHLGTGQIFAYTKGMAFRWDFSWNAFMSSAAGNGSSLYNNLFLSLGVSFFFPEATYR